MQIDVRGEICPYPLQKAIEAMDRLPAGEDLVILSDHPPSLEMIRMVAAQRGFSVQVQDAGPGEWRIALSRKEAIAT